MDITPNGYYDIIIITRTTKYYMDIIWILHQMGIMTLSSQPEPRNIIWILYQIDIMKLTPQLALGWGALHIVGTMGGGVLTWMVECTKNLLLNLLKICILCKSRLALFALPIFQEPICAIMFDSVCIYNCNCVQCCI